VSNTQRPSFAQRPGFAGATFGGPAAGPRFNFGGPQFGSGGPHAHWLHQNKIVAPWQTARRILGYIGRKRTSLVIVFACAAVATAISVLGTRLSGYAVDHYIVRGDLRGLAIICGVLLVMYLCGAGLVQIQNALMARVAQRTAGAIRHDLFHHMQRLPLRYFDTHPSGDTMSRLTNDIDAINTMLSQGVVQLFSGVVMIAGTFIAMVWLSPLLTAIGVALAPVLVLGPRFIIRRTQAWFVAQQRELGVLNGYIEEMVSGQKTVVLHSREKVVTEEFAVINRRYQECSTKAQELSGALGPLNMAGNNLIFAAISVFGTLMILRGHGMTVGVVFAFLLYMRAFVRPINEILMLYSSVQSALASAERVFVLANEPPEQDQPRACDADTLVGDVVLENVTFSYGGSKNVLAGVTLHAKPGQMVAVVGPTGAGKTTITNLLARFYDFNGGAIRLDGQDIRSLTASSVRSQVSIVLQDPFLFSVSVRENIRYGRLGATDEEVEQAARLARAHDFILQLSGGYDTRLDDNGGNLSTGQRQLLSIARAILARPAILILDEATSSVDTRTEILIQEALHELMRGTTCFVIAHRLSTIRQADTIVVLDGGQVVESGTHEQLIASNGFYSELHRLQFSTRMPL
jgi:ATP-binding cassette subfamily B protein